MGPFVEKAMSRVPITLDTGIKTFFCGPESFTPDFAPIVGEAPEIKNYFVAAGLNSIGIIIGGGLGPGPPDGLLDNQRPSGCGYYRI
jgi:4-methylaminobutanoate oxidase (formaldehyde-forming)